VGVTLAAITDDGDRLVEDTGEIGVAIVVDTHKEAPKLSF
jgi:hypothetical protein